MYIRQIEPQTKFNFLEKHHFYWGTIITIIGFYGVFAFWPESLSTSLLLLGLWVAIDDAIQHIVQAREITENGAYTSVTFWHWFPYFVWSKIWQK